MRSVGSEVASTLTVLLIPAALAFAFPYGALGFRATPEPPRKAPSAAFVSLSADEEAAALHAAKTTWRNGVGGHRRPRIDMSFGELPEERATSILDASERISVRRPAPVPFAWAPFLPSRASPPPPPIAAEPTEPAQVAFPRNELLKID